MENPMLRFSALLIATMLLVHPVPAQRGAPVGQATPRANQGHVPPPPSRSGPRYAFDGERLRDGRINESQHVNHDQWFGHSIPNDPRFHLEHPFAHGRFPHPGPGFRYPIVRIDRDHHWFWFPGGFYFVVAPWDWPLFADWCWNCGDDFVVYDDPDHIGWYLLYNIHTGLYVHVQYLGM
jgi:hypothetical protein